MHSGVVDEGIGVKEVTMSESTISMTRQYSDNSLDNWWIQVDELCELRCRLASDQARIGAMCVRCAVMGLTDNLEVNDDFGTGLVPSMLQPKACIVLPHHSADATLTSRASSMLFLLPQFFGCLFKNAPTAPR